MCACLNVRLSHCNWVSVWVLPNNSAVITSDRICKPGQLTDYLVGPYNISSVNVFSNPYHFQSHMQSKVNMWQKILKDILQYVDMIYKRYII